jgi:hypothetical protein
LKLLAMLAAVVLVPTGAFTFASSSHSPMTVRPLTLSTLMRHRALTIHRTIYGRTFQTFETGGTTTTGTPVATGTPATTATPVATGTPATPQPTVTGTTTTFPDPIAILQKADQVDQQITSVHFELSANNEQTGVEKFTFDAKGDATCKGPAIKGNIKLSDTLEATSKVTTGKDSYVVYKKKAYVKGKDTKKVWKSIKPAVLAQYGISADNLLLCPNAPTSSGGSGSNDQIKNVVNLGPDTVAGVQVWHIQAQDVTTDSNGNSAVGTIDWYISQDHFLTYKFTFTISPQSDVTEVSTQLLSKFNEKVSVKVPKVGSKS